MEIGQSKIYNSIPSEMKCTVELNVKMNNIWKHYIQPNILTISSPLSHDMLTTLPPTPPYQDLHMPSAIRGAATQHATLPCRFLGPDLSTSLQLSSVTITSLLHVTRYWILTRKCGPISANKVNYSSFIRILKHNPRLHEGYLYRYRSSIRTF